MARYYFKRGATRVFRSSMAAIVKAAQEYSDEIGRTIPVFEEAGKRIGATVRKTTYAENPSASRKAALAGRIAPGRQGKAAKKSGASRDSNPHRAGTMASAIWERQYDSNPTKASKARRIASNKRGAYVEYIDGTKKKRILYGNKGIATIRAAAMKRDGWRGVRVVSA